ncbi:sulfotransferase [Gilvimarinus sp. SDUM040013]|uniref:Sulfotransferase n=1 Tax=Gilvimarinus gilvus TaxID=3058038 RepID=A0ABU4RXY2_9GAMM|nr:sulfotransferase [Gilvimarinus sp. SDUM040013]MDO3387343.1 sulfotransferase [Gilvimarinus sp. SDUM040013]MDX6849032.1 sulfotransferase [Gilvimarinus sp. SDUM040013]
MTRTKGRSPDFFCIGAQRSGTSWLYHLLRKHPDVWLTPHKELHYFDCLHLSDDHATFFQERRIERLKTALERVGAPPGNEKLATARWFSHFALAEKLDDDWYTQLFRDCPAQRVTGDITPAYAMLPLEGFRHMARLSPSAKILFIMRDPAARVWSQIRFYATFFNNPGLLESESAIAFANTHESIARTRYDITLELIEKAFDEQQILTIFFEDLHHPDSTSSKINEIMNFLDIAAQPDQTLPPTQLAAPPAAIPNALLLHLERQYADMKDSLERRFGRLPESWRKAVL